MAEELAAERGGKKPAGSEKHMMWGEVFAVLYLYFCWRYFLIFLYLTGFGDAHQAMGESKGKQILLGKHEACK